MRGSSRLDRRIRPAATYLTRYFDLFTPASSSCPLPPSPPSWAPDAHDHASLARSPTTDSSPGHSEPRDRRLDWAALLERVVQADVLAYPRGGRRAVVAFVVGPTYTKPIPERLNLPSTGPPIAPARAPPLQEAFDLRVEAPDLDPVYPDR